MMMLRGMKPLLCFLLLVLCFGISLSNALPANSRRRTSERTKYVSISNKAKNEALVHCKTSRDDLKKVLDPGERIRWGLWDTSMVCFVDIRKADNPVCGYFVSFPPQKCKRECRWRILDDGKMELKLVHGKWKAFKLAAARNSSVCGARGGKLAPAPMQQKQGSQKPNNGGGVSNCGWKSNESPQPEKSSGKVATPPINQKPHQTKNAPSHSPVRGKEKSRGKIAPPPTEQNSPEPKKCVGNACPKNAKQPPSTKVASPLTKQKPHQPTPKGKSREPDVKLAPAPTQPQSKKCNGNSCGKNPKPPASAEGKQKPGKANAKLAPSPTNERSQQPKKCGNNSCGKNVTKLPMPVKGQPHTKPKLAPATTPTKPKSPKGKGPSTKIFPPPTKPKHPKPGPPTRQPKVFYSCVRDHSRTNISIVGLS